MAIEEVVVSKVNAVDISGLREEIVVKKWFDGLDLFLMSTMHDSSSRVGHTDIIKERIYVSWVNSEEVTTVDYHVPRYCVATNRILYCPDSAPLSPDLIASWTLCYWLEIPFLMGHQIPKELQVQFSTATSWRSS